MGPPYSGDVAQLGERLLCKQEVTGSIPVVSIRIADLTQIYEGDADQTRISAWLVKKVFGLGQNFFDPRWIRGFPSDPRVIRAL